MTHRIVVWKARLWEHRRWWAGLILALVGGILGVHFGFAGNYPALGIFSSMFVIGLWLR